MPDFTNREIYQAAVENEPTPTQDRAVGEAALFKPPFSVHESTEGHFRVIDSEDHGASPAFVDRRYAQWLCDRLNAAPAPVQAEPFAYAYRYQEHRGTVIRFNHGETINGAHPIETIPLYVHPAAPAPVVGEREAFERWAGDRGFDLARCNENRDQYLIPRTSGFWRAWREGAAWQARAAAPARSTPPQAVHYKDTFSDTIGSAVPATGEARRALTAEERYAIAAVKIWGERHGFDPDEMPSAEISAVLALIDRLTADSQKDAAK
jgi:hypothetical protein